MSSASRYIVGTKTVTSEEVVEAVFACPSKEFVVDAAVLEKVAEAIKPVAQVFAAAEAASSAASSEGKGLDAEGTAASVTRAALFGALAQLAETRGVVRPEVLSALAAAASSNEIVASIPGNAGRSGFVHAVASFLASKAPSGSLLASERSALSALGGDVAAIGLLACTLANNSVSVADAVAATTLEAVASATKDAKDSKGGAVVSPASIRAALSSVTNDAVEIGRPHPGVVACAGDIRTLLENSRSIAAAAAAAGTAASAADATSTSAANTDAAVAHCAHIHGSCPALLSAALRTCAVELNSSLAVSLVDAAAPAPAPAAADGPAAGGEKKKKGGAPALQTAVVSQAHPQPVSAALGGAVSAVSTLARASLARGRVLASSSSHGLLEADDAAAAGEALTALEGRFIAALSVADAASKAAAASASSSASEAADAAWVLASSLLALVKVSQHCFAAESALAELFLAKQEKAAQADLALKEAKKAESALAREKAEAAKLAAMTPEERAKAEEAAAKKAQKEKEKKDKEAKAAAETAGSAPVEAEPAFPLLSNGGGVAPGTLEWRSYLAAAAAAIGKASASSFSDCFTSAKVAVSTAAAPPSVAGAVTPLPRADVFVKALVDKLGAGGKRKAKIAKGARDFGPEQMEIREKCFGIIRGVFKRHGAVEIDTPVFELRETLLGKYGEEGGKLIYDLADQGGELLSLRYDLTVPFARYVAMHGIDNIKRFHIARVYRRDNPQMARGRFREFYQCDFDIAGNYATMMPDAEVLSVAVDILSSVPIGPFTIKLNHRKLLDATLDIAGVPASKFRSVCSTIDKLDKETWEDVRAELITEKGCSAATADKIGEFVQLRGEPRALLKQLKENAIFAGHAGASTALKEMEMLFSYLQAMGGAGSGNSDDAGRVLSNITFDLSLARGLDYYTGSIYEAVLLDPTIGVGSIAAGGRYDHLVGMFSSSGTVVPCVGVSVGVERVLAIMEAKMVAAQQEAAAAAAAAAASSPAEAGAAAPVAAAIGLQRTPVAAYVASIPSARYNMACERMKVLSALWQAGIPAEMSFASGDPKLQKQVTAAAEGNVPFVVVIGEDELDKGLAQVKNMRVREAHDVPIAQVAETLIKLGARTVNKDGHSIVGGSSGGAASAAAAAPAATSSATTSKPTYGPSTIGVKPEGQGRIYGKFVRPSDL